MSEPRLTNLKLYLQRLGFDTPPAPTLDTLRQLQLRHTGAFPFENLATITGAPVLIDLASIEQKVFDHGRGGYCYELNHLFFALLLELGFDARAISGRVVMNQPEGSWTARTHRLSLVTLDGVRYITDVGFGGMVPTAPLILDSEHEQSTPHEPYRIENRPMATCCAPGWRVSGGRCTCSICNARKTSTTPSATGTSRPIRNHRSPSA